MDTEYSRSLSEAYETVLNPIVESKVEKVIDSVADRISSAQQSPSLEFINDFYTANQSLIESAANSLCSLEAKSIENAISGFAESAKVVMKGLDALGQVHPFIGVAVVAFKLVVTLDITRRQNNKKVMAVRLQMQDMMCVLFQLRHLKEPDNIGPDGTTLKNRLQSVVEQIAKDITTCGSACDVYMKKSFLAKTIKSKIYESRLADYGKLFANHRDELEHSLAIHTALGVDAANKKLDNQHETLQRVEEKLDMMLIFRKLDTPREREVMKFIDDNGGAKACIEQDELLNKLVAKTGETLAGVGGHDGGRRGDDLVSTRKLLTKELVEDVDDVIKKNLSLFEGKLDIQSKIIAQDIHQEGEHIITAILAGAHERIHDPDLRTIWKEMGWKGSVKARHFVLALRDYFMDRYSLGSAKSYDNHPSPSSDSSPLTGDTLATDSSPITSDTNIQTCQDDHWALSYINVAHLQPILEAIDDDGTGFINVKEANTFVIERPQGWSLMQWLAYWAAGWHLSVSKYRCKIYLIIQQMLKLRHEVLPDNRIVVDEYLDFWSFTRLELLLRSTKPLNDSYTISPELSKVVDDYSASEENRLELNLKAMSYNIDSAATVELITGPGRIERYIYPVIYLLLKCHLKYFKLARYHVLDFSELFSPNDSLLCVFHAFDERIKVLEAIAKQIHLDSKAYLENFAFGMFQLSHGESNPVDNTLQTWKDETAELPDDDDTEKYKSDACFDMLKSKPLDTYHMEAIEVKDLNAQNDLMSTAMEGSWAGHCSRIIEPDLVAQHGLVRIIFGAIMDGAMSGKLECHIGTCDVDGTIIYSQGPIHDITLKFKLEGVGSCVCLGKIDTELQIIKGDWWIGEKDTTSTKGWFLFSRTPDDVFRFRYTEKEFTENPSRARWSFACSAILDRVRRTMWSWSYMKAVCAERKRYIDLNYRRTIEVLHYAPKDNVKGDDLSELRRLKIEIPPTRSRLLYGYSQYMFNRKMYHLGCSCDACNGIITRSRFICITCVDEKLGDNIDLCLACLVKDVLRSGFVHNSSHSLIRSDRILLDCEKAWMIPEARTISIRVKESFRDMEATTALPINEVLSESHAAILPSSSAMLCACCGKAVQLPCLVCVECTPDTFICAECDSQMLPVLPDGPSPNHVLIHNLIRIFNDEPVEPNETDKMNLLGKRFENLQGKMEKRIVSLEKSLDKSVEDRLDQMKSSFDTRFSSIETMLQKLTDTLATFRQL